MVFPSGLFYGRLYYYIANDKSIERKHILLLLPIY